MSRQYWSELLTWSTSSGTPVTNTTTETIVMPAITIPAFYLHDGRVIEIKAFGQYSTGTGPPTLIFGARLGGVGGTLLAKTAAITTVASMTAIGWELELLLQSRSNGSSGTIMANGHVMAYAGVAPTVASATGAAAVTPLMLGGVTTPGVATVDMTVDQALVFTATWSASSTSHTLTGLNYTLKSEN